MAGNKLKEDLAQMKFKMIHENYNVPRRHSASLNAGARQTPKVHTSSYTLGTMSLNLSLN